MNSGRALQLTPLWPLATVLGTTPTTVRKPLKEMSPPVQRRILGIRWFLTAVLLPVVLVAVVYGYGEYHRRRDYRPYFIQRHGCLTTIYEAVVEEGAGHQTVRIRLENDGGLVVDGYVKAPSGHSGPTAGNTRYPAFLLLGGVRTGKNTLDYIHNTKNIVMLALDYPYPGKKSGLSPGEFIRAIRPIRRAVIDTPPAAMLGVDYLLGREDVDPERIILVGGSVGAVFVPAVAATDTRIAAAVMLFGAADIETLLSANINATRWIAGPASWLGAVLTSPVEPAKYVADITPRPVFMLNGTGDPRMPEYCSRLLHETAKEPKSIRWIDAGHVDIRSKEFHSLVSRELAAWLIGQDLISRENFVEID